MSQVKKKNLAAAVNICKTAWRYSGTFTPIPDIRPFSDDWNQNLNLEKKKRKRKRSLHWTEKPIHIMGLCSRLAYPPAPGPNLASSLLEGLNDWPIYITPFRFANVSLYEALSCFRTQSSSSFLDPGSDQVEPRKGLLYSPEPEVNSVTCRENDRQQEREPCW